MTGMTPSIPFWENGNILLGRICCCCSVAKSCPTLCSPMGCSTHQASLSFTISQSFLKLMSIESVMLSNHLILCHLLLLLLSIFPNIRVFSNKLALLIRWSKYWSFSISPFNEYSGLIDWFDLLAVQGYPCLEIVFCPKKKRSHFSGIRNFGQTSRPFSWESFMCSWITAPNSLLSFRSWSCPVRWSLPRTPTFVFLISSSQPVASYFSVWQPRCSHWTWLSCHMIFV